LAFINVPQTWYDTGESGNHIAGFKQTATELSVLLSIHMYLLITYIINVQYLDKGSVNFRGIIRIYFKKRLARLNLKNSGMIRKAG